MDLKKRIQDDMKTALKAGEAVRLGAIRMLLSEVKKREIDKREPLGEGEIHKVVQSLLKQRADSIEAFLSGGRADLVDKERAEVDALKVYLPSQMSAAEVEAAVVAAIAQTGATKPADMGKVMKVVLATVAGRADGKLVNELVRARLPG